MFHGLESGICASGIRILNADVNVVAVFEGDVARSVDGDRFRKDDVARLAVSNADAAGAEDSGQCAVETSEDNRFIKFPIAFTIDYDAELGGKLFLAAVVLDLEVQVGENDVEHGDFCGHSFAESQTFGHAAVIMVGAGNIVVVVGGESREILAVVIDIVGSACRNAETALVVVYIVHHHLLCGGTFSCAVAGPEHNGVNARLCK